MKKKIRIGSAGGMFVAGLVLVMLFSSIALASPPVVQLITAKTTYTLDEQVRIGMRMTPVENWVGLAALFFKFESTAVHLADFNNKYWSVDGFHTEPRALIPRTLPLHYYGGMDCTVHTSDPCFMSFPARALGAGTYTFHTLLMDRLGFAAAEFENSARLRNVTFTIQASPVQPVEPQPGDPITEDSLVGEWDVNGRGPTGSTNVGIWSFNTDNTFDFDRNLFGPDGTLEYRAISEGTWAYDQTTQELRYEYTYRRRIYPDGTEDERSTGFTSADGTVAGDALNFTMVQANNWTFIFTRK